MCLLPDHIILSTDVKNTIKYSMEDNVTILESTVVLDDDTAAREEQQRILLLLLDVME